MINQGLTLTLLGMGVVFSFLILLVLVMNLKYLILKAFFPRSLEEESATGKDKGGEIAVAIAAVQAFIKNQ